MTGLRRRLAPSLAIAAALLAAGCGGIFSDTPRRPLYQLKPALTFGAPMRPIAAQLLVALPSAPAGLDTNRVALSRSAMSLDYYADAEWSDSAPLLDSGTTVVALVTAERGAYKLHARGREAPAAQAWT